MPKLDPLRFYKSDDIIEYVSHHGKRKAAKHFKCSLAKMCNFCRINYSDWSPPGNRRKWGSHFYVYIDGRVWNCKLHAWSAQTVRKTGHTYVQCGGSHAVHKLVLECFDRKARKGEECRHLNGDATYNHKRNLKWGTPQENVNDRIRHGMNNNGSRNGKARLNEKHVLILRKRYHAGERDIHKRYARRYGMSAISVKQAITGRYWRHI